MTDGGEGKVNLEVGDEVYTVYGVKLRITNVIEGGNERDDLIVGEVVEDAAEES